MRELDDHELELVTGGMFPAMGGTASPHPSPSFTGDFKRGHGGGGGGGPPNWFNWAAGVGGILGGFAFLGAAGGRLGEVFMPGKGRHAKK